MENALGGAAVAAGIVQHALFDAIGMNDLRGPLVAVERQGERARHAGPVQHEGAPRQFGDRMQLAGDKENPLLPNEKLDLTLLTPEERQALKLVLTTVVQRMFDKTELERFKKDSDYEPMCYDKMPMDYWD